MESTKGFYDYGVLFNEDKNVMRGMVLDLIELGYKTIAIEQVFDHTKKDAIKRGPDIFPAPVFIDDLRNEYQSQIRILQRLTIIYTEPSITHVMASSFNVKKYNLIAGQPKTDAALTNCCTTFNGDIVTFDPEAGSKLLVNRKAYIQAIKRGMFFEIKYAPAIRDSANRKDMIKIAHNYRGCSKKNAIIFSSGAKNIFELRGPYDVANLGFIFGLSDDQGKNAVDKSCRQLFLRAESRRLGKTIMFVKGQGPICFSDSSESEESDMDGEIQDSTIAKVSEKSKIRDSSPSCEIPTQSNKKRKFI